MTGRSARMLGMLVVTATLTIAAPAADPVVPAVLDLDPAACTRDLDWAQVTDARLSADGDRWTVSATVRHADTGWEHYADAFAVVHPDTAEVIAVRVLYHPHVDEQPFTRSLTGVTIPEGVEEVLILARCNVHGFGGCGVRLPVPR